MLYKIAVNKLKQKNKNIEEEPTDYIEKEGYSSLSRKRSVSGKSRMRRGMGNRGRAGIRLGARTRRIG
jgi:hypothetical protein